MFSGGTSLHFNGEGIRLATTKPFDASNIEEFTFVFYYGDDCAQTKTGSQVSVAISNDFGINWDVIKTLGRLNSLTIATVIICSYA